MRVLLNYTIYPVNDHGNRSAERNETKVVSCDCDCLLTYENLVRYVPDLPCKVELNSWEEYRADSVDKIIKEIEILEGDRRVLISRRNVYDRHLPKIIRLQVDRVYSQYLEVVEENLGSYRKKLAAINELLS